MKILKMKILKILTLTIVLLLFNQLVYAASASRSILVYNINTINGISDEKFDKLKEALADAKFTVDVKNRKDVPELTEELLSKYSQLWLMETDASPSNAYAFSEQEKKYIWNFVNRTGGLLIAGEEDLSGAVQKRESGFDLGSHFLAFFEGVFGIVDLVRLAAGKDAMYVTFRGESHSWTGNANVFSGQEVSETLAEIQYGSGISFTNTINPIAARFGVVFEGLTDSNECKTNNHNIQWSGAGLARNSVQDLRGRYDPIYPPFCIEGPVNSVGGRISGKCPCAQVDRTVAEEIINTGALKNVKLLYIDGREPIIIPFRNDINYVPVAFGQRNRTDTKQNHVIAIRIPHVVYDVGAFGNIYFDASWTRYTNDYPRDGDSHISEGDTTDYAVEVAEFVEPYADIYRPSCEAIGSWVNGDENISTTDDNCCWEPKKGIITKDKKFLCAIPS